MNNRDLLSKLEENHQLTAHAILQLRELVKNGDRFTAEAVRTTKEEVLDTIQLNISELQFLASELGGSM